MTSALLPNELRGEICRHSATSGLLNLSLVSQRIQDVAAGSEHLRRTLYRPPTFHCAPSNEFLPYGEVASLESELANVRTVALDGQLRQVDGEGPDKNVRQWSDARVESSHEGSMRHPDDYWLFRNTGLGLGADLLHIGLRSQWACCLCMPTQGTSPGLPLLHTLTRTPETMLAGYEFNASDADIVLVSNDAEPFEFRAHKCILAAASPFFRTMFSLSQHNPPSSNAATPPPIPVSESKTIIEALLQFIYPIPDPPIRTLEELTSMLGAAIKYEFECLIASLRKLLVTPHFLTSQPVRVFAIACRFDLDEEAKLASRYTLRVNVLDCPLSDELKHISAYSYHQLLDLHRRRARAARELVVYAPDSVKCALCTGGFTRCSGPRNGGRSSRAGRRSASRSRQRLTASLRWSFWRNVRARRSASGASKVCVWRGHSCKK
ncbi:hypothetical protein EYR36_003644 [Pleurotus pulmonarius]|nr:hypothetical protein EYR36_003644 [Pleurotus pulmonarius]